MSSALKDLPAWCDKEAIEEVLMRRSKKTAIQVSREKFMDKAKNIFAQQRYSEAFKVATLELAGNIKCRLQEKRGFGVASIVLQINGDMPFLPMDKNSRSPLWRIMCELEKWGNLPSSWGTLQ